MPDPSARLSPNPAPDSTGMSPGRLWNVPPLTEALLGRPEVSENILARLLTSDSSHPSVLLASALPGQGGIGKTVLAQIMAHHGEIRAHFRDGVYWLPFGQDPAILDLMADLIHAFDPTFKVSTVQAASTHLRGLLSEKAALLILDDAWEEAHLQPFLVGGEACRFLITARDPSVLRAGNASLVELNVLTRPQALQLFEGCLGRTLDAVERDEALHLAKVVEFLPLGLNLAAARVRGNATTWTALTGALRQEAARLHALENACRLLPQHVTLEASLLLSLRSLESRHANILELFSWFGVLPADVVISAPMMATFWGMEEAAAADLLERLRTEALLLAASAVSIQERDFPGYRLHTLFHQAAGRLLKAEAPQGLGLSLEQAHQRVLERYRSRGIQSPESEFSWTQLWEDGYIHDGLFRHMEKAGALDQMMSLLQEETVSGGNAWYVARERLGQIAGYVQDVRRTWDFVRARSRESYERGEPITTLGLELRFVLMLASVNSIAASMPVSLVGSLVRYGIWKPIVGLAYIKQAPDEEHRSQALVGILPCLTTAYQLAQAFSIVCEAYDPVWRARGLIGIAPYLNPLQLRQALLVAESTEDAGYRIEALAGILPHLAAEERPDVLQKALSAAAKMQNENHHEYALCRTAVALARTGETEQAFSMALEIRPTRALAHIAPYLSEEQLQKALTAAHEVEDSYFRAEELSAIAAALAAKGSLDQALAISRQIEEPLSLVRVLAGIAPHMQSREERAALVSDALSTTLRITAVFPRVLALRALAPYLAQSEAHRAIASQALDTARQEEEAFRDEGEFLGSIASALAKIGETDQALSIAREMKDTYWRCGALAAIAPHLKDAEQRTRVLSDALSEMWKTKQNDFLPETLGSIASYLASAGEAGRAFSLACGIEPAVNRVGTLTRIADYLTEGQLQQTLSMAETIDEPRERVRALTSIVPHLPDEAQRDQVTSAALSIAQAIHISHLRASALLRVVSILAAQGKREQALLIAWEINEAPYTDDALSKIASMLAEDGKLEEALAAAQAIQFDYTRNYILAKIAPDTFGLKIPDADSRIKAMIETLPPLATAEERTKVIAEALSFALEARDSSSRHKMLAHIAPHLSEAQLQEVISRMRGITSLYSRADALSALTWSLAKSGKTAQALAIARETTNATAREHALTSIVAFMATPEERTEILAEALSAAREITDAFSFPHRLRTMGRLLSKVSVEGFYPNWDTLLQMACQLTRHEAKDLISTLAWLLVGRKDMSALEELILALGDVERWWP